jgi:uncharacterized protein (DUF779 family)
LLLQPPVEHLPADAQLLRGRGQVAPHAFFFHQSGGCCDNSAANAFLTRSRPFTEAESAALGLL